MSELLAEVVNGQQDAADRLMPLVFDELHVLAERLLRRETPGHTLQPTALVNEAYVGMVGHKKIDWKGKTHFFAIGAQTCAGSWSTMRVAKNAKNMGDRCSGSHSPMSCASVTAMMKTCSQSRKHSKSWKNSIQAGANRRIAILRRTHRRGSRGSPGGLKTYGRVGLDDGPRLAATRTRRRELKDAES